MDTIYYKCDFPWFVGIGQENNIFGSKNKTGSYQNLARFKQIYWGEKTDELELVNTTSKNKFTIIILVVGDKLYTISRTRYEKRSNGRGNVSSCKRI